MVFLSDKAKNMFCAYLLVDPRVKGMEIAVQGIRR